MKTTLIVIALASTLGCEGNTRLREAQGAIPAVETPIGPVPGPGVASSTNPNPYSPTDPVAVVEGRRLFKAYNCSGCHGEHAGGGMGPSLRDVDWMYGDNDAQIYDSIAEGRAHGMPSWGTKLPEDHIWKLATYIRSMRTAMEPDRPWMAEDTESPPAAVLPNNGKIDETKASPGEHHHIETKVPSETGK
jgi:cytochrome c oxidase cbb3-type subunit 3